MKKRILSCTLITMFAISIAPSSFAGSQSYNGVRFSTEPTERAVENAEKFCTNSPRSARFITLDGDVIPTELGGPYANDSGMMRRPPDYFNVVWTPGDYVPNHYDEDDYRFFVSSVSLRNNTGAPMELQYAQQETVNLTWEFEGEAEVEADFGIKVLSDLHGRFSASVKRESNVEESAKIEFKMVVPAGKEGYIDKYYGGVYSGGLAIWNGFNPFTNTDYGTYEEEIGAWAICENEVHYDAYTRSIV